MATRPRDVARRLREKLLRAAKRASAGDTGLAQIDDATRQGLAEIAQHHDTWLAGLTLMLTARNLPPDEHTRQLAAITAIAADRAERMRSLWLTRADYLTRMRE